MQTLKSQMLNFSYKRTGGWHQKDQVHITSSIKNILNQK